MYKFVLSNNRTIQTNNINLPKEMGAAVVRMYRRSEVTGKFVRVYDHPVAQENWFIVQLAQKVRHSSNVWLTFFLYGLLSRKRVQSCCFYYPFCSSSSSHLRSVLLRWLPSLPSFAACFWSACYCKSCLRSSLPLFAKSAESIESATSPSKSFKRPNILQRRFMQNLTGCSNSGSVLACCVRDSF